VPAQKPARLNLRLSPQLRDALRASAAEAGCSLNAFAVQVLAAAAGHRARFRGVTADDPTPEERGVDLREIARDESGYPLGAGERWRHLTARNAFIQHMERDMDLVEVMMLVRELDATDPARFVEWAEQPRV
jgi:hypothetical protein